MGAMENLPYSEDATLDITGISHFGVAILDDPEMEGEDTSGWASVEGNKAFRFSRLSDLESDTIWLNNASFDAARRAKHYTLHNQRGDSFLGSRLPAILDDITAGAHPANNQVAQQLSAIADKTCRFALKSYKDTVVAKYSLGAGIFDCIGESRLPTTGEPWLDSALMQAYQKGASCDTRSQPFLKNAKSVQVRHNRVLHAARVMETLIPDGGFEYISGTKKTMTPDILLGQNRPVLAQVSISKVKPEVAGILGFGSYLGGRQGRSIREWVAGPELALLAEFATVKVKGAVFWETAVPLQKKLCLPKTIDDGLLALSYSVGLMAESHLAALTMGKRNDQSKMMQYSPRAVYLAAMDRALTFPLVRSLRNEGYTIMYYGNGSVLIRTQTPMLPGLSAFVRDAGLAFPLPEIADRKIANSNDA